VHREILTFFHRSRHGFVAELAVEHVHLGRGEFACRDAVLEQVVEFGERSASRFGDAEVGVDDADEAGAADCKRSELDRLRKLTELTPRKRRSFSTSSKRWG
jgi:hypothetical protein